MRAYIHKCVAISAVDSFEKGILHAINNKGLGELIEPDYKSIIPAQYLRRMSKVIRMGVAAALHAKGRLDINGIIVGSGLGCFDNSAIFTREYLGKPQGLLSPTSFIQSTDNTIAGQIGLILNNHCYNITYLHKGIAFENALIDAVLLAAETGGNILVGAVDEKTDLFEMEENERNQFQLGEGANFFIVNAEKSEALACVKVCTVIQLRKDTMENQIAQFLKNNLLDQPDLILYGNSFLNHIPVPKEMFRTKTVNYSSYCGVYFSNSAFGVQLGTEILAEGEFDGMKVRKILVINNFFDKDFGLTYLINTDDD